VFALTVLYGQPDDPEAFEKYYDSSHKEVAQKVPNVRRKALGKAVGVPGGGKPAYYRSATLFFDNREDGEQALASPEGLALLADIPKFSTGGSEIFFADIKEITVEHP
jgi:uncharacterized protein (TIGR02118 family)